MTSNDDIEWGPEATTLGTTLVIANEPGIHDINQCLVFNLPDGSSLQKYANMQEHPENYNKRLALTGTMAKVLNTYGLTGNQGSSAEFELEGVEVPDDGKDPNPPTGEVTFNKVASVTSGKGYMIYTDGMYATPLNATYGYGYLYGTSVTENAGVIKSDAANAYTLTATDGGYFLSDTYGRYLYMTGTYDSFNVSATATKGDKAYIWTVEPQADGRFKITNASTGKYIQYDAAPSTGTNKNPRFCSKNTETGPMPYLYEMDGTAVAPTPPTEGGDNPDPDPDPENPDVPSDAIKVDLSTFGKLNSTYATYTSTDGWVATWAQILSGSATPDNRVTFEIFGTDKDYAVCLNGRVSKQGSLVSPVLTGGIGTLYFDYCLPYTDNKIKLTVNIKQGGAVVATTTVEKTSAAKLTKYTFAHDFSVSGDFTIEIINECPSANDASNKDRTAVWNIAYTR